MPSSASFHCGDSKCEFHKMIGAARILSQLSDQLGFCFSNQQASGLSTKMFPDASALLSLSQASVLVDVRAANGQGYLHLKDLLLQARSCKATDSRDKVFSMLGLVDSKVYGLTADYRLETNDIYKAAAVSIISKTKPLDILSAALNPQRHNNLPSWAPNLIEEWKARPLVAESRTHLVSQREAIFTFDAEKDYIVLPGSGCSESVLPELKAALL